MDADLTLLSARIGAALRECSLTLATAESCTGGWAAQIVTHTAGSSAWFDRGFVTYSNEAKAAMLGVSAETLAAHGAVSVETAAEMAAGAIAHSAANVALAITGVAGPTGGSAEKPVGTVCFAWCRRGEAPLFERRRFDGDREAIRRQSAIHALEGVLRLLAPNGDRSAARTVP